MVETTASPLHAFTHLATITVLPREHHALDMRSQAVLCSTEPSSPSASAAVTTCSTTMDS